MEKYAPMSENINIEELQEYIGKWLDYHAKKGKQFNENDLLQVIAKQRKAIKRQMQIIRASDCVDQGQIAVNSFIIQATISFLKKGANTYRNYAKTLQNKLKELE